LELFFQNVRKIIGQNLWKVLDRFQKWAIFPAVKVEKVSTKFDICPRISEVFCGRERFYAMLCLPDGRFLDVKAKERAICRIRLPAS